MALMLCELLNNADLCFCYVIKILVMSSSKCANKNVTALARCIKCSTALYYKSISCYFILGGNPWFWEKPLVLHVFQTPLPPCSSVIHILYVAPPSLSKRHFISPSERGVSSLSTDGTSSYGVPGTKEHEKEC